MKKITGVELQDFASRFWTILAPYKQRIWRTIAWILLLQAVDILPPYMFKFTIDFLSDCLIHEKTDALPRFLAFIGAMLVGFVVITTLQMKRRQYVRNIFIDVENDLPPTLLDRLLTLPFVYHQGQEPAAIIGTTERGTNKTVDVAQVLFVQTLPVLIQIIITAAILWYIYWPTLLIIAPIMGMFALLTQRLKQRTKNPRVERHARIPVADRIFAETVKNFMTVTIFHQQKRAVARLAAERDDIRALNRQELAPSDAVDFKRENLLTVGKLAVLCLLALAVLDRQITLGSLVFVFDRASVLLNACSPIGWMVDRLVEAVEPIMRMTDILQEPRTATDPAHPISMPNNSAIAIEFEDVSFSYRSQGKSEQVERRALNRVSLTIPRGKKVGIVGLSGAGKTTLAQMILRLFTPDSGSVRLLGVDVRMLSAEDISRRATMVPQNVQLFWRSVADNIRYGRPDATMDDVVAAATLAHAHKFIMGLPQGYATPIGGSEQPQVSGGERQRIGIARAILINPEILILDEPTSNIDAESQANINDSLRHLREQGMTILIIAHQLSTVRDADQIVVMENGGINDIGTHDGLMVRDGLYARLVKASES